MTGHGQYTDDIRFEREAHAAFHRSPHAHARIVNVDVSAAKAAPGVIAVLTQADVDAAGAGPMACTVPVVGRNGFQVKTDKPLLAGRRITFTGEAIAMVVAETYAQAVDAAELVAVEYEALDAAGTLDVAPSGPQIWETAPGNLAFDWAAGQEEECNAAFARAAHSVALEIVQNRIVVNSMETRNAIGLYDPGNDSYTLYTGSQGAGGLRDVIAKTILKVDKSKLRVVTNDVGGGFGMKTFFYPEQGLALVAAKIVSRPVRWTADRTEAFLADDHGRDMRTKGELALDKDGRILAMRVTGSANMGGYLSQFAPFIPTHAGGRIFGGVYRVPVLFASVKCYFSNSAPVDAYRGAGRPEAAYLMERLMDAAAAKIGIDRVELRKRNLPAPDELPYRNWFGVAFDCGNYPYMLDEALKRADFAGFAARRQTSEARGLKRGLGIAYYVEITAAVGSEPASVKFTDDGSVEVYVGTQSNGQGHETAFAQLVAERLGVPFESIAVKQGDTEWVNGGGTGGSRSLNMAGGAVQIASDEVIRKGKMAAGQVLQAGSGDVDFEIIDGAGRFRVAQTDRALSIGELAAALRREKIAGFRNGSRQRSHLSGKRTDVSQWLPCLRSRDRSGNRRRRCRALSCARRFRPGHQSHAGGRPGAWRCRAGAGTGAARELRLRPADRTAVDRELQRLCDAQGRRSARHPIRL